MPRLLSTLAAALLALALAAVPVTARTAHAAGLKTCHVKPSESGKFGPTYVLDPFKVQNVSCSRGKAVIRAFHSCRSSHGGKTGRCPRSQSVLGYHCTEQRSHNAVQISGKVTCVFGSRRVIHYYEQNTH
jgi:hypothetical protein